MKGVHSFTVAMMSGFIFLEILGPSTVLGQCELQEFVGSQVDTSDRFGRSVAMNGDIAVVSAPGETSNRGAVYIYGLVDGVWVEGPKLTAQDGGPDDRFGAIVSISEDALVIAARTADCPNGSPDCGAAYIFRLTDGTWSEEAKLTPHDPAPEREFGRQVAIDGDLVVVGSHLDDEHGPESGAAYIFRYNGAYWVEEAKLTPSDAQPDLRFGLFATIDGKRVLVGANRHDGLYPDSGAAYIFRYDGSSWVEEAKLTASDETENARFGSTVSLDGDTAAVGAGFDDHAGPMSGSAYVFRFDGSQWVEEAKLTASQAQEGARFGIVKLGADRLLVSARREDCDDGPDCGAVYIFEYASGNWVETARITASDAGQGDDFGIAVAHDRNYALVGARYNNTAGYHAGVAYYFAIGGEDCNENGQIDLCDIREGSSDDANGNGIPDECEVHEPLAGLDIRPGTCPNRLNPQSHGILPVAVVATESLDVAAIVLDSLRLSRVDGVGGTVTPLAGPPGPGAQVRDVGAPCDGDPCRCPSSAHDGIDDLVLKFRTRELVDALQLGSFRRGSEVALVLEGILDDGTEFEATDCVLIVGPRHDVDPPRALGSKRRSAHRP